MDSRRESENGREFRDADPVAVDLDTVPLGAESHPSIGAYLATQRQLRGISRQQLCRQTQIPLRSLERLETGVFDAVNDGFVRGFVRTVAGALGLDQEDTLARMSQEPTSPKESPRTLSGAGLVRVGALLVGLSLVLISVGLVGVAVQSVPGKKDVSPLVMRSDPVRALALARGVSSFSATQALVPPASPTLPTALDEPLRADAHNSEP